MAQQHPAEAPAPEHWSSRVWPQLLPELAERIVGCLSCNDVAAAFRQVNKATAEAFSGPQHTIVRLSEPVPPHAFAAHWLAPGATRGLTLKRRRQLLSLAAASGVVANLEVAIQAAGCLLTHQVFEAAASAGKLEACQWLWEQGCPENEKRAYELTDVLAAAAGGGHRHVCEWLLGRGVSWQSSGAAEAARGGHVGLMEWLLERRRQMGSTIPEEEMHKLVCGVVHGCDLATLQRQWGNWGLLQGQTKAAALRAAAGSPTPDWAAKVEWLEAQGCPRDHKPAAAAAICPNDAAARLAWLRGRGYSLDGMMICSAARMGNLAAVQYLLSELGALEGSLYSLATFYAAGNGHLEVLQALRLSLSGQQLLPSHYTAACAIAAASSGHLHVLAWLPLLEGWEWLGTNAQLLLAGGAESGSVELLAWLVDHGCGEWSCMASTSAAESGGEEALEWVVAHGCPVKDDGSPYLNACRNGDLAMVRLLRRLEVPWGPAGRVVLEAARIALLPLLRWLLEEGCPVGDYEAAKVKAGERASGRAEALQLLEAQQLLEAHWPV
ncbi:hypothetical protein GPECTOR_48g445 [Gonium pectorale]|uniref:Uncharacterized protein n=1 Tax=Gonium pectorale TaxID=33097 RepID=A0A150G8B9_GONPE|nr:hypothetical protein GPECTOR_48g445 [Gonium pectorale]|eukprot:KXZ46013.1 hypothetical protein GPECTOR_48g445 [Gonium pectorale]